MDLSGDILALRALGATFLLLIWLYVLANVIVFGAALNWQLAYGRTGHQVAAKRAEDQPASAERAPRGASALRVPRLPRISELCDGLSLPPGMKIGS